MNVLKSFPFLFVVPSFAHEGPHFSHRNGEGHIDLETPSGVEVQMQKSEGLSGKWVDYQSSRLSVQKRAMSFQVPLDPKKAFYRFNYKPLPLIKKINKDGKTVVDLTTDLPLKDFMDLFYLETGYNLYPRLMYSDLDGQVDQFVVGKGSYELGNPEDLSEKLGIPLWIESAEPDDNGSFEESYTPKAGDQGKLLVGPVGDTPMEKWSDDNTTPYGEIIDEKKELLAKDFKPDPTPGEKPQDDTGVTFSGKTLRMFLSLNGDDYTLDSAVIDENSGTDYRPASIPQVGDFVYVIKDENQDVEFIGRVRNPLRVHADHGLDQRVGGAPAAQSGRFALSMPLEEGSQSEIESKSIEIFRVESPFEILTTGINITTVLTPELIENNKIALAPMSSLPADTVFKVLAGHTGEDPPEVTTLFRSGSNASKFNIAVIGDGFDSSDADQNTFKNYVENIVVNDLFIRDIHPEIRNSINLFRIDTISEDSGVTQVDSNSVVTVSRDTALDYRYSGIWDLCWLAPSSQTSTLTNNILASVCPQAEYVIVVLNEPGPGGCNRGTTMGGTLASPWSTVAHEFGHLFGELGDEYGYDCNTVTSNTCNNNWTGGIPSWIDYNLTVTTNNQGGKWEEWIPSWRNMPTSYSRTAESSSEIADRINDVSLFAGATGGLQNWRDGIWRPSITGRMDSNARLHNPIGYDGMRQRARLNTEGTFRKNLVGDFDGDGRDDLVLHDGRQLSLYLSRDRIVGAADPLTGETPRAEGASVLEKTWFHNGQLWADNRSHSWSVRPGDRYYVADFDGDGRDDLYVFNSSNWSMGYCGLLKSEGDRFQIVERYDRGLPGWSLYPNSDVHIGDFNGDGRDDFLIYNGHYWRLNYIGIYLSEGDSVRAGRRINGVINDEWFVGDAEEFHIGDFNGDGRDDFLMAEQTTWSGVHLRAYTYDDSDAKYVQIGGGNYQEISDNWWLGRNDNILVGDFDGDGIDDVALHNGTDWNNSYLGLFSVTEGAETLELRWMFESELPGWQMTSGDRFYVGNFDGDGDDDLIIFNGTNWGPTYLGMARSHNGQLGDISVTWQSDWIGGWRLGEVDEFKVCDFKGTGGWEDLFVFNDDWFGLLRSHRAAYQLESFNYKYINQVRYHEWGVW